MWTEYSHAISFADPGAAKLAKGRQLRLYVTKTLQICYCWSRVIYCMWSGGFLRQFRFIGHFHLGMEYKKFENIHDSVIAEIW